MTTLNTNTNREHGNIIRNRISRQAGTVDNAAIERRARAAETVLRTYSITATGSRINGWGESVEAYTLIGRNEYEVQIRPSGEPSCNCPDWIRRRSVHGGLCKHSLAILALRHGR